jgi:hypothetical protein
MVLGRLKPDADRALLEEALAGMRALQVEGMLELRAGTDAGLREGNWDYGITADFADEAAYRRYDADEEHNRLRREGFGVVSAEVVRTQFLV